MKADAVRFLSAMALLVVFVAGINVVPCWIDTGDLWNCLAELGS